MPTGRHLFRTPEAHALPEDLSLFRAVGELAYACGLPNTDAGSCVMRPIVKDDNTLRVEFHGYSQTVGAQAKAFKQALVDSGIKDEAVKESGYRIPKEGNGVFVQKSDRDYFGQQLDICIPELGGSQSLAAKINVAAIQTREMNVLQHQPAGGAKFRIDSEKAAEETALKANIEKFAAALDFPKSGIDEHFGKPEVSIEGNNVRIGVASAFNGEKRRERPEQTAMQQTAAFQSKVYTEVLDEKPVGLSVKTRGGQWIARSGFEGYEATTEFTLDAKGHGGIAVLAEKFGKAAEARLANAPKTDTRFQDGIRAERTAIAQEQRSR